MANSKLLDLIQSFSPEENEAFLLFLNSPYFVRVGADEMLRYFKYLLKPPSDNQEQQHDKEALHQAVYPEKPFSEARLERASTRLYHLAEQFLKIQYYQLPDNQLHQELEMATIFRRRNMITLYKKQILTLKKKTAENKHESTKNHFFKYQIASEEHIWQSLTNNMKTDLAIADLLENLDLFYYNERTEMLNRFSLQQRMGNPKTTETLERTLAADLAPDFLDPKSPLLLIRKKIRESFFLSEPDRAKFENLATLLKTHEQTLADDVTGDLYSFLRSYCTYLISSGQIELQITLHELQKDNLKRGYFHFKGKMSPVNFSNITRIALSNNQIQWAKEFVESNRKKILSESELEEVYKLNMALCFFEEKKFEQALPYILYSFHANVLFWVARRLELRTYFELKSDLLPFKIEAFRKYMQRTGSKNASGFDIEANTNFIHVLLQLSQSAAKNAKRSTRIIQRIYQKKIIAERRWLLEKAQELA